MLDSKSRVILSNEFRRCFHEKIERSGTNCLQSVTVLLTEALEELVKGEVKTGLNNTLSTCCSIYPDLFSAEHSENQESNDIRNHSDDHFIQTVSENEKVLEVATESEKEYYEGFMARPKIPRTPQV